MKRDFEPLDPPKPREGVCRMCGHLKPLIEAPVTGGLIYVCAECWELNKDL
jgi:hypothetical protein